MILSDVVRAVGVLATALAGAAGLSVFSPELRAAGLLPQPADRPELVYSIVNVTESMAARQTCQLDLEAARRKIDAKLAGNGVAPVFSPIAEGPGVLLHEVSAEMSGASCRWTATARLDGRSTPLRSDRGTALSSLDAVGRDVGVWLDTERAGTGS